MNQVTDEDDPQLIVIQPVNQLSVQHKGFIETLSDLYWYEVINYLHNFISQTLSFLGKIPHLSSHKLFLKNRLFPYRFLSNSNFFKVAPSYPDCYLAYNASHLLHLILGYITALISFFLVCIHHEIVVSLNSIRNRKFNLKIIQWQLSIRVKF